MDIRRRKSIHGLKSPLIVKKNKDEYTKRLEDYSGYFMRIFKGAILPLVCLLSSKSGAAGA
jgi:hypothetical protein